MASTGESTAGRRLNPPEPLESRSSGLSDAQLRAAAKVLDSYLHRARERTQPPNVKRTTGSATTRLATPKAKRT